MKRYARATLMFILAAVAAAGCDESFLLVDTQGVTLPAEVQLRVGKSVILPREGYVITLDQVTADSRCPRDVVCVWEGDGAVKLSFRDSTTAAKEDTLHTTLEPKVVQFQVISVRLKKLDPYPVSTTPIDPTQYVATLEIDRAN